MSEDAETAEGWATGPQDTREQTCEYTGAPGFSVLHTLRVARAPDPSATTVARTHDVTVEWTSGMGLPEWLATVATVCTPYGGDRFGTGTESAPDDDGRFQAAPIDASVRPPTEDNPALSDPYHYWNTPLARLRQDEHYPADVTRITVDLVEGPDAVWTGDSTGGVDADRLPRDRDHYARIGLEFTARERLQRATEEGVDDEEADWFVAGDPTPPDTNLLSPTVEATMATDAREILGNAAQDHVRTAIERIDRQVQQVWTAFRWDGEGDPYRIPEAAARTATTTVE